MNLIYLSNIQKVKSNDDIKFVPYFNHQNQVKNKKISFKSDIICLISIIQVSKSDTCRTKDMSFMRRVETSHIQ